MMTINRTLSIQYPNAIPLPHAGASGLGLLGPSVLVGVGGVEMYAACS